MKLNLKYYFILVCITFSLGNVCWAQTRPLAKFTFNTGDGTDLVSGRKAKCVGVTFIEDRFGNDGYAVFLSGNENSYLNLGNYKALKPESGSISLWVNVEYPQWSGKGAKYNPILLTKNIGLDDFYEAYGLYYVLETKRLCLVLVQDSTREITLFSKETLKRNSWHHIAFCYNDIEGSLYIDGKLEKKFPKNFKTKFLSTDSVVVGGTANKKNRRWLNGAVDDIEFYDKILTPSEIETLYNAPNPNKNKIILNWILAWAGIILFAVSLYLFIRYRVKKGIQKEKEKMELENRLLETELRVNRASMNPHFLFNSLNALHNFILANENDNASDYLLKFAKLIRQTLDSNMFDSISLELEIELLDTYLDIENLRFEEDIKYSITTDKSLPLSTTQIPIMMLQPFVENSIWHGLREKTGEKIINISFASHQEQYVLCTIEDNGIGRKIHQTDTNRKKSLAINFIIQRLELLNKIKGLNCNLTIEDKPEGQGTVVKIILPLINKL